nr:MAG TPA: hypothetical protein [Bacteriophage sp.]
MQFDNTRTFNWEGAFHGMRAPLESWAKSDSAFGYCYEDIEKDLEILNTWREHDKYNEMTEAERMKYDEEKLAWLDNNGCIYYDVGSRVMEYAFLGPADLDLAQRLIKSGPEHRKFLRQIFVSAYITGPLFWWKEYDTYKIATVANSTSTMHKIQSKPITKDCFEINEVTYDELDDMESKDGWFTANELNVFMEDTIDKCEDLRKAFNETKDKRYWKMLIELLPESWLQSREVTLNYETIRSIVHQRKGHKLVEWQKFVHWAHTLPYAEELIFYDGE